MDPFEPLQEFIDRHRQLFVLTGAGVSTQSGLGDYRDRQGQWKRRQPISGQSFVRQEALRKRYWARSFVGWPGFSTAEPNRAHHALRQLQSLGIAQHLVTQNVDQLHQKAGHTDVIDLHGVLATVSCIACQFTRTRDDFQQELGDLNRWLMDLTAAHAPDGDADLELDQVASLQVPACAQCHDLLKPDVVFFGENVPRTRVADAMRRLQESSALLVVGSSLMVYSGLRFCRAAADAGQPIAIVNDGQTRADDLATLKMDAECGAALESLLPALKRPQ